MGIKLRKKGSFDEMMDIILGAGLLVVGIIFLMFSMGQFRNDIDKGFEEIASLDIKNDLISFLNTPLESLDYDDKTWDKFSIFGLNKKSNVMDFLYVQNRVLISDGQRYKLIDGFDDDLFTLFTITRQNLFSNFVKQNSIVFTRRLSLEYKFTSFSGDDKVNYYGMFSDTPEGYHPTFTIKDDNVGDSSEISNDVGVSEFCETFGSDRWSSKPFSGLTNIRSMNYDGFIEINLLTCKYYTKENKNA